MTPDLYIKISLYKDIIAWYKHLNAGGIICGDDWWCDELKVAVRKAAQELGHEVGYPQRFWWFVRKNKNYQEPIPGHRLLIISYNLFNGTL